MSDPAPTLLTALDLGVRYNEHIILDGASLTIREGEHVGLVGRNGSGKSTFLKILAGKQTADRGELTSRRGMIVSYLSQEFTLDAAKTVYENRPPRLPGSAGTRSTLRSPNRMTLRGDGWTVARLRSPIRTMSLVSGNLFS